MEASKIIEERGDVLFPPTKDEIEEIKKYNIGGAMRLASRLGRPLSEKEFEIFRKAEDEQVYKVTILPSGRFGVAQN
jgi:hypothetical protein